MVSGDSGTVGDHEQAGKNHLKGDSGRSCVGVLEVMVGKSLKEGGLQWPQSALPVAGVWPAAVGSKCSCIQVAGRAVVLSSLRPALSISQHRTMRRISKWIQT